MICTDGCPSSALSYKWKNPLKENFQFKHYGLNREMFTLPVFTDKFHSVHARDFLLLPLILAFGFTIDGLYGMGHFLSFGIATISAILFFTPAKVIKNIKVNNILGALVILLFVWHGVIKFSIWKGLEQFENHMY